MGNRLSGTGSENFPRHTKPNGLWKTELSSDTGKSVGSPVRLLSGTEIGSFFTLSGANDRLLYTRDLTSSNLFMASPNAPGSNEDFKIESLTSGTSIYTDIEISPDGKEIAFIRNDPETGSMNLYVMPSDGGSQRQITFSNYDVVSCAWSPDGREIAFTRQGENGVKVWKVHSSGGMAVEYPDSEVSKDNINITWSPGTKILYRRRGNRNYHLLDPGSKKEEPLVKDDSVGWMFQAKYSHDREKVALFWNRSPSGSIWIVSLKDRSEVSLSPGGAEPFEPVEWSSDGKWIYVKSGSRIQMIRAEGGDRKDYATLPGYLYVWSMTSDGQKIVCSSSRQESDVWLAEDFDPY